MAQSQRASVALVSDAIYPYHRGGKELRYHELGRRLAQQADVTVYTMNWWKGTGLRVEAEVKFHSVMPLRPLYVGGRRSLSQALFFAIGCLRLLGCRFDVLEADHMPYIQIPVLRLVALVKRKPFVVTWHEVWGRAYWRDYLGVTGLVAWLVERWAMRLPDTIIAASPQTAARLRSTVRPETPIFVAPNGVDLDTVRDALPQGNPVDIVAVGRLIEHKRIDMLLRAIALLRDQGVQVTCRIIGDGPERSALRDLSETLGVMDAIEFRHDVDDQKELYGLMKSARLFAFPSAREGFGIAMLEAIACGLPVVTTSAADNLARDLAARYCSGVICEPSTDEFAEAIRRTLAEFADRQAPQTDWLAEYTWDAAAAQVALALAI